MNDMVTLAVAILVMFVLGFLAGVTVDWMARR